MLSTILIVVLVLLCVGAMPTWGYSGSWGVMPSGLIGVILLVLVIYLLLGHSF